ncbi:MAG TPA: HAMP domain-containing sensor histidine kinase [Candidatus Nitrosotalea sp.]|nr:HAMP domain-containing sensor histidine kinase [Candidatus Nitrosotalea sp.]
MSTKIPPQLVKKIKDSRQKRDEEPPIFPIPGNGKSRERYIDKKQLEQTRAEIIALFSHELKTPMTLIIGWSQVLRDYGIIGKLNKNQVQAVNTVYSNAIKLKSAIEDILDTEKLMHGTMLFTFETIELDKFIKRIIRRLKPMADERGIRLVNMGTKKIVLRTDESRLEQVITGLIINAIDFVPKNTGVIKIGSMEYGSHVGFFVMDNGKGMSKEVQTRVFEKLYQEDTSYRRKHSGLGLGLFLCKGIVESLGGIISVESKMKKGTTFYFTHPKDAQTERFSLYRGKNFVKS